MGHSKDTAAWDVPVDKEHLLDCHISVNSRRGQAASFSRFGGQAAYERQGRSHVSRGNRPAFTRSPSHVAELVLA